MAKKGNSKKMQSMINKLKRQAKNPNYEFAKKKRLEGNAKTMSNKLTSPERVFLKMMKEIKVKVESQKIVKDKIYDFYIPSKNMLIEVDGDYWHGNPEVFKEHSNMQKKNIKNDIYKDTIAKGLGYKIERVWEKDLNENYIVTKKRFNDLLNG